MNPRYQRNTMQERCDCQYCEWARRIKKRKPKGSRRILIVLFRYHRKEKGAALTAPIR